MLSYIYRDTLFARKAGERNMKINVKAEPTQKIPYPIRYISVGTRLM